MKLNCAEFHSKEPTEEMIVDLVRNNAKRGEFMILEADDGESFVQIAGEYDAANPDACVLTLEYREAGKDALLYHAVNDVTAAGAAVWCLKFVGVTHEDIYDAVTAESAEVQAVVDDRYRKLDRIESKLDKLLEIANRPLPDGMERAE